MHIVQLLLPLFDNEGRPFPEAMMRQIREELVARFGGVTAFSRTPAEGVWSDQGHNVRDEIILVEVMVETLDREWWGNYREQLQARFEAEIPGDPRPWHRAALISRAAWPCRPALLFAV